ncbi:MAG: hypothetical protein V3V61_01105 [Gammaproteobacteria bacterium]
MEMRNVQICIENLFSNGFNYAMLIFKTDSAKEVKIIGLTDELFKKINSDDALKEILTFVSDCENLCIVDRESYVKKFSGANRDKFIQ